MPLSFVCDVLGLSVRRVRTEAMQVVENRELKRLLQEMIEDDAA